MFASCLRTLTHRKKCRWHWTTRKLCLTICFLFFPSLKQSRLCACISPVMSVVVPVGVLLVSNGHSHAPAKTSAAGTLKSEPGRNLPTGCNPLYRGIFSIWHFCLVDSWRPQIHCRSMNWGKQKSNTSKNGGLCWPKYYTNKENDKNPFCQFRNSNDSSGFRVGKGQECFMFAPAIQIGDICLDDLGPC